jgi:cytidine deaminase
MRSEKAGIDDKELVNRARAVLNPRRLSQWVDAGGVGSALVTDKGNVYTGVCIGAQSGVGFCAEHSAIAAMITAGENRIVTIVAVNWDGKVLPPCGRCREFIYQVNDDNGETRVILEDKVAKLRDLLPDHWSAIVAAERASNQAKD